MMKVVAGIRNQTLSPLIDICRADPRRTPGGLPARFRIRRAFFALAFLARLNVPFTVRAHPFMARQCSSTARLRQQLVLAGPLRATRARLQPTSSASVDSRRLIPATPDRLPAGPSRRAFCFAAVEVGRHQVAPQRLNAIVPFQDVRSKFVSCWNISKHPNLYYCTDLSVRPQPTCPLGKPAGLFLVLVRSPPFCSETAGFFCYYGTTKAREVS